MTKHMSKNMPKSVDFGTHFESNLLYVVPRPQHAHPFLRVCSSLISFYRFCVKMGTPLGPVPSVFLELIFNTFLEPPFFVFLGKRASRMTPKRGPFLRPWT